MAESRRPTKRDEEAQRRQLKEWRASVLGTAKRLRKGNFDYICQMTDRLFLFLSNEGRRRNGRFFVLNAQDITLEPITVPTLSSLLVDFTYEEQSLRYDESTASYFFCSQRGQMDGTGFSIVRGGVEQPEPQTISTENRVSSLFVTERHVILLDAENAKLVRISKATLMAMADTAGARKLITLDPHGSSPTAQELEYAEIPIGKRLEGGGVLITAFSSDRLIFGRSDRYALRIPVFPRLHALDLASNSFKEFWFPSFACGDFAKILEWAEDDPRAFDKYLSLMSLYEIGESNFVKEALFFSEKGVFYTNGEFRSHDPEAITSEKIAAFADLVDFRFRNLMSADRRELDEGIIKAIDAPLSLASEDEIQFVREKIGEGRIETADWDKLNGERIDLFFLDSLAKVLAAPDGQVPLARRWLERNRARQYVALALLTGRIAKPGPASVLDGADSGLGRMSFSRPAGIVFSAESEIPVETVRNLAERSIRAVGTLLDFGEDELTAKENLDMEDHKRLLEAVAAAAITWETEAGYNLVRWLDAQDLKFIKVKIASLIGEREAHSVRDLLGLYLAGDDADLASAAVLALWNYEAGEFSEALLRWLKSAEDFVPGRAAYALGMRGVESALLILFYSEIISIGEEPPRRGNRFDTQESNAIARLLEKILRSPSWNPPLDGRLAPGEIAEMEAYAPYYLLHLVKRSFQNDDELTKPSRAAGERQVITAMLAFLNRTLGLGKEWVPIDFDYFSRIARRTERTAVVVEQVLALFLDSDFPEDAKYILALHVVFTPGLLNLARPGEVNDRILILLKSVFDRMLREKDHRRIFAAFALVELGIDRTRERDALEFFRKDEWREWPRLMRLGERVLRYLPGPGKTVVYEKLLQASMTSYTISRYVKKLVEIYPRRAVELYEQGLFKLNKLDEALLYGRTGDRRGYDYVLANFTKWGDVETIVFLGDYGGKEAVPALEKARGEHHAPAKMVNLAIRKIRSRVKAEIRRSGATAANAGGKAR